MNWEKFAKVVGKECGMQVDREEGFAVCPFCGEPIYADDWRESDYTLGRTYLGVIYCPVCETVVWSEEEIADEEEDF